MGAIDSDEIQALVRMSRHPEPFIAIMAQAILGVMESQRDAEIRAASAEAALATEREKLATVLTDIYLQR